jgi:hypothetical protein
MTMIPPAQYEHPPSIPVVERVMSWDDVSKLCANLTGRILIPGEHIHGCAVVSGGVCYIWRLDDAFVRRHEVAHCNGWRHQ